MINDGFPDEVPKSKYDIHKKYDNDYTENYFDNGKGDDNDNLGGGGVKMVGGYFILIVHLFLSSFECRRQPWSMTKRKKKSILHTPLVSVPLP